MGESSQSLHHSTDLALWESEAESAQSRVTDPEAFSEMFLCSNEAKVELNSLKAKHCFSRKLNTVPNVKHGEVFMSLFWYINGNQA